VTTRRGWSREECGKWSTAFAVFGTIAAFGWLGTDSWFLGLVAIISLALSFWADIEADRNN